MTEEDFAELVALVHEAALGVSAWSRFGEALRRTLDASRVALRLGPADGSSFRDLMQDRADPAQEALEVHYRALDPSLPFAVAIAAHRLDMKEVAHVFEMVPERQYRHSAFYADHARQTGMYHRLGFSGIRGGSRMAPFSVYRAEGGAPFEEGDREVLLRLKPHIKRALNGRRGEAAGPEAVGRGLQVLAPRTEPSLVVDGGLGLVQANEAAGAVMEHAGSPLRLRAAGPSGGLELHLPRRADREGLLRLVQGVALLGEAGASLRLRALGGTADPGMVVSAQPMPPRMMMDAPRRGEPVRLVLLVLTSLRRRGVPAETLLRLFGLTVAEAEVAALLSGGATAEAAAAGRGVTAETVRTQIRSILRKLGASGMRDFERMMAQLPP